jgi:hypothetical protein
MSIRELDSTRNMAIGMDFQARFLTGLSQGFEKALAILVTGKNGLAAIPAAYEMIKRTRISNSHFARHD